MIHPSALIHPGARLGSGVSVGAFSLIGEHVEIAENTWIGSHCVVEGHTRIGPDNRIFQFCSIGAPPQDKKYAGEPTALEIGARNTIREYCSLHTGTVQDGGVTRIGNDNWIMASVHVAHDCQIGSHTILANNVTLAGHVHVGDWAILGGLTAVHQFVRVGEHSFCGGGSILLQDLPPYVMVSGNPASPHGINTEGLKRRGYDQNAITAIKQAYRLLYRQGLPLTKAREGIAQLALENPCLESLSQFLTLPGRGLVR
jgi:UDP-N-acetylglucosamine acyltransferase